MWSRRVTRRDKLPAETKRRHTIFCYRTNGSMVAIRVISVRRLYNPAISCLRPRVQVIVTLPMHIILVVFPTVHLAFEISTLIIHLPTIVVRRVSRAWRNQNCRRSKNQKSAKSEVCVGNYCYQFIFDVQ